MYRNKDAYRKYTENRAKRSPVFKNSCFAFLIGGGICAFGEALLYLYQFFSIPYASASLLVTVTLIFFSALLTGFGVFDTIARVAGAGTLLPVTGFANAVVSPALDTKSEGIVLGVGSKIFTVAGPVLLYSVLSGVLYGIYYFIYLLFV